MRPGAALPARVAALALAAAAILVTPAAALEPAPATDGRSASAFGGSARIAGSFAARVVPVGFTETIAFSGLTAPTNIEVAQDGRVFVAEKSGLIKVFDDLDDPTATVYADLRTQTHDFWDRGLLGMALDPGFTSGRPFVYALYAYNKEPGVATFPRWPDACPSPPGATGDGCVVSGRLVRLNGGVEQVLIEDWCQQYPSHSVGDLAFGPDGALYVSGGDGASFNFADYGQDGNPVNPCGDPPGTRGSTLTPPTAEGGALRSQDIRTTADPTGLNGAILRVDPDTGAALPDNPNAGSSDANARRIVAYGFRNPFRMTVRPGTSELWVGDVGWASWEEINRIPAPTGGLRNHGWPCYEGDARQGGYDGLNVSLCETLYSQGSSAHVLPYFRYNHGQPVVSGEGCVANAGSSTAGLAFHDGTGVPAAYEGALFFADYSRDCIWVAPRGNDGLPDMAARTPFVEAASNPVDLEITPTGDILYADFDGGTIRRIRSTANAAPTARATANASSGAVPLTVAFSGAGSSDPNGDTLAYAWDLDGDGQFDDSTAVAPSFTYTTAGTRTVRLRVTDPGGLSGTDQLTITAGAPPAATIAAPAAGTTWQVGDTIGFSGSATTATGAPLPASALRWRLDLEHCEAGGGCHTHQVQTFDGVSGGSFTAPDHEYPTHLELHLTATDAAGLATTVTRRLDPRTVTLDFETQPAGLALTVGGQQIAAPFGREVIVGSRNSISAPTPQTLANKVYAFSGWSDGGAQAHTITAPGSSATYRATYAEQPIRPGLVGAWSFDAVTGGTVADASGLGNHGTVTGATPTTAGRNGGALSFDGVNDWVTIADANVLDLTTGMTLEAWVNASAAGGMWRTVMLKETAGNLAYALYSNEGTSRPSGHVNVGGDTEARGAAGSVPANTWTHLATTYDGAALRMYVNGSLAASRAVGGAIATSTGPLRLGGNSVWSEWFAGRLDDVRVYDRALSGAEIADDMSLPVGGDPGPRLAVSANALTFTGVQGGASPAVQTVQIANAGTGTLSWEASESTPWMSVSPGSGSGPADLSVSVDTTGLPAGTHTGTIQVAAAGASGSPQTITVTLTVDPQPPPPTPPALATAPASLSFSAPAGGAAPAAQSVSVSNTGGGTLSFTASDDQPWLGVGPASGTAPATLAVSVAPGALGAGTYTGSVTVDGGGVSGSPKSIPVTLTITQPPPSPTSLVGAWSFDEASGTTAQDSSARANQGTVTGATRAAAGRYGRALSFDGVNDWVTIADGASLDLTTGMTLEAWVRPAAHGGDWRTVVMKEQPGQLAYALYANQGAGRPSGHAFVGGDRGLEGPSSLPLNTWSHLAVTYDGATLRLFVNGTQVATSPLAGPMITSASPLRIGGNAVWNEWFIGLIDEVRVHDRALTAAQIAADRDTPIATAGLLARSGVAGAKATSRKRRPARTIDRVYGQRRANAKARGKAKAKAKARRKSPPHRVRWLRPRAP